MSVSPIGWTMIVHPDYVSVRPFYCVKPKILKRLDSSSPYGESSSQDIISVLTKEKLNKALEEWFSEKQNETMTEEERKKEKLRPKADVLQGMQKAIEKINVVFEGKKTELSLVGCNLEELPPILGSLTFLKELNLNHNFLKELPSIFGDLKSLTHLECSYNKFEIFPSIILEGKNLGVLNMDKNFLKSLPYNVDDLENLKILSVRNNKLEDLPITIKNLDHLYIDNNKDITIFPYFQPKNIKLQSLFINGTSIKAKDIEYLKEHINIDIFPLFNKTPAERKEEQEKAIEKATQEEIQRILKEDSRTEKQKQEEELAEQEKIKQEEQAKEQLKKILKEQDFPENVTLATSYQVFKLSREANQGEIKKRYKILMSIHHPDKGGDKEKTQMISEMYDLMLHPSLEFSF